MKTPMIPVPSSRRRQLGWLCRGLLISGFVVAASTIPASADWLVLNDGGKVETDGPWKVKGRLVIFDTAEGKLSSLRLHEVDLEASEAATRQAVEEAREAALAAARPEPVKEKTPVFVLTDADIPPARPRPVDPGATLTAAPADPQASSVEAGTDPRLRVTTWDRLDDDPIDGVAIGGELSHNGTDLAGAIELLVEIFDSAGELIAAKNAVLSASVLRPGERASFRAEFPLIFDFSAVKFTPHSTGLKLQERLLPDNSG